MTVEQENQVFIRFECPKCQGASAISARHTKTHKVVNCSHCGLKVRIPPQSSETPPLRQPTQTKPNQKPEAPSTFQEVFFSILTEPEPSAIESPGPITEFPDVAISSVKRSPKVSKGVIGSSKHIRFFQNTYLESGETVLATAPGWIGKMMGSGDDTQHNGELIVTTRQVVFYRKGLMGEVFESIPIKGISSIQRKSFVGCHTITFHTSHNALEFKSFDGNALLTLTNLVNQLRNEPQSDSSPMDETPEPSEEIVEIESATTRFRKPSENESIWVWGVVGFCTVLLLCFGGLLMGPSNSEQVKSDQPNRPASQDRYSRYEIEQAKAELRKRGVKDADDHAARTVLDLQTIMDAERKGR